MAIAGREQLAQHRFEIVDVTTDVIAEHRVLFIELGNGLGLARFQQAHCPAGEYAPIALQV